MANSVEVTSTGQLTIVETKAQPVAVESGTTQVVITEVAEHSIELQQPSGMVLLTTVVREAVELSGADPLVVEVATEGPQGPSGDAAGLPAGGNPGNILIKDSYDNFDASWTPYLDGGTFN